MALDALRLAEVPAVASQPTRVKGVSVQSEEPLAPVPRHARPSSEPAAHARATEEVRLQWDGDYGVVVKFTDARSGEVLHQIPSDQILGFVRFIKQMLEDQKAGKTGG